MPTPTPPSSYSISGKPTFDMGKFRFGGALKWALIIIVALWVWKHWEQWFSRDTFLKAGSGKSVVVTIPVGRTATFMISSDKGSKDLSYEALDQIIGRSLQSDGTTTPWMSLKELMSLGLSAPRGRDQKMELAMVAGTAPSARVQTIFLDRP